MDLRESSENVPSEADGDTEMEGVDSEGKARSTASYRTNREMFFPDRQPRKSQALNPEETWKIITNVIPPDLMDTRESRNPEGRSLTFVLIWSI